MDESTPKLIATTEKGWQKEMAKCLKKKQPFYLLTNDESLVKKFCEKKPTAGFFKAIFIGGVINGVASTVGLTGSAKAAFVTSLAAAADPEPISKALLTVLAIALGVVGAGFVMVIIMCFVKKPPKFSVEHEVQGFSAKWKFGIRFEPQA